MVSRRIKLLQNDMMEEYSIRLPEQGGNEITVTDDNSGLTVRFECKDPIDVENMGEADYREIARQAFEILNWWTSFDGDKLINGDEEEDD